MKKYPVDNPQLWEVLGVEEDSSEKEVLQRYLGLEKPTKEQRLAMKVLTDRIVACSYRRYRSTQAILDAGFFDDLVEPGNRTPERDDLNFLTTPVYKIVDSIKEVEIETDQPLVVLLSTGSFNPIHEGHIQMMENAKQAVEEQGRTVVGGYLSLGHDDYSLKKYPDSIPLSSSHRLLMCEKAVAKSDWLMIDPWEARYNDIPITYTEVIQRLERYLNKHLPEHKFEIVYVFGGDNAGFARAFVGDGRCICVRRPEYESMIKEVKQDVFVKKNERIIFAEGVITSSQSSSAVRNGGRSTLDAVNEHFWDWKASIGGQVRQASKYYYAIRNDLDWATHIWSKEFGGDRLHDQNRVFLKKVAIGLKRSLTVRQIQDKKIDCRFIFVDLEEQQRIVDELAQNKVILNLDSCTKGGLKINFSRLFGVSNGQYYARRFVSRPGFKSILDQVKKIRAGKYTVVDDDIASGRTIELLRETLPESVELGEKIGLLQRYVENHKGEIGKDRQMFDVVDSRDFLIGSTNSGLVVCLPNGEIARAPYIQPYVSLVSRANVLPANEMKLSISLWRLNYEYFVSLSSPVRLIDCDLGFRKLMEYVGFRPEDRLSDICVWHINQLIKTTGVVE